MRLPNRPLRKRAAACLFGVLAVALALTAWGARARPIPAGGVASAPASLHADAPPESSQAGRESVEVEVLTLSPRGFEPSEVKRPAGRFMLVLNNHIGGEEVSLVLARVQGERLREVKMSRGRIRSVNEFDLPPGEYVLSTAEHPEWSCRITLTPR